MEVVRGHNCKSSAYAFRIGARCVAVPTEEAIPPQGYMQVCGTVLNILHAMHSVKNAIVRMLKVELHEGPNVFVPW